MLMKLFSPRGKEMHEYGVLVYRFLLIMAFYSLFRVIFYLFNGDLFPNVDGERFATIMLGGLKFDLSAVLYLNALYFLLFLLPLPGKFNKGYQTFLKWWFVAINAFGFSFNAIDLIYYRFILKRTTYNVLDILQNEENMGSLWGQFLIDYWYVLVLFIVLVWALSYTYSIFKPRRMAVSNKWLYGLASLVALVVFSGFTVVGMRGGYRHSTRPITMSNAGKYVNSPDEMALVLNTPFCIIRTWGKKSFTKYDFFESEDTLNAIYSPERQPDLGAQPKQKNVVIFMLESFSREYFGTFNQELDNGNYKGYTPFLDSLSQHSLVFPNAFANGRKSIDAMPSVIASIPALVLPYVVSEYSGNKINSLAGLLTAKGYETAFFHGAPNGSMGFQSFAKVAGFQKYMGKDEYDNDDEFDGMWGIWDEPFFQFYAREMNKMKEPFYTTLFSVSSHHPFKVPEQYTDVFPKGTRPLHQCIGYTDNGLRKFFETAKTMPWYENTLFVITADHSSYGHYKEYQTTMNKFAVPLIFFAPGDSLLQGRDNGLAQQIDIMPTVLDYLGYDQPYVAFGNDLLDANAERFVINYINGAYQVVKDDYVIYFNGKEVMSVFNYKEDPYLKNNLKANIDIPEVEEYARAVVQQYNNRMIEDRLTMK